MKKMHEAVLVLGVRTGWTRDEIMRLTPDETRLYIEMLAKRPEA